MAAKRKDIMDIRQILQLKSKGLSNRKIASMLGISRNTINEYISFLKSLDKDFADLLELDDGALEGLFPRQDYTDMARYEALQSKFSYYRKELTKVGCTLQHLWYEYKAAHPEGYGYTQFVSHYRKWSTSKVVSGILEHKAGNQLFMDYTGKLLHYIDKNTGEQISAEVFVCILPCSRYTYVQALASQRKEDFIAGVNGCLQYLGGVPQALVSDNLKSGVTKAHNYAPKINKTFKDCGLHYNSVIDPARPLKPQDKGLVENAVRWVYQRIFYPLSKQTFFSLEQLNEAILPLLEKYNDALLKNRDVSRRQLFVELEQSILQPLPAQPYILRHYKRAKVQKISHIFLSDDKCYYSVPYTHIGKQVEVQYNKHIVEIYYDHTRLASHQRSQGKGHYITDMKHMPSSHQVYNDWSLEYFVKRATPIGLHTVTYIERLINQYNYPEQAYKQAQGILAFRKHYGNERLEKACERGLYYSRSLYGTIETILTKGLDLQEDLYEQVPHHIAPHSNVRGAQYYQ